MTPQEEQRLKDQFIVENPYARDGLRAALMYNPLYAQDANRRQIHNDWIDYMGALAEKYVQQQPLDTFLTDVCELKAYMNQRHGASFLPAGFKYSHAQKSLAVFLKYRWCQGLITTPPSCPIDRGVLHKLGRPFSSWSWTKMEECKYMPTYIKLQREADLAEMTVAQMELLWFSH